MSNPLISKFSFVVNKLLKKKSLVIVMQEVLPSEGYTPQPAYALSTCRTTFSRISTNLIPRLVILHQGTLFLATLSDYFVCLR